MELIGNAIHDLIKEEPYFGYFVLNSRILYDSYGVPTAGATMVNSIPTLVFNTDYVKKWKQDGYDVKDLLKHEVLHLLLEHTTNWNGLDQKLANVAMDCSINQFLGPLPENTVSLELLSKELKKDLPEFQAWKYYYNELLEYQKQNGKGGDFGETVDDHDIQTGESGGQELSSEFKKALVDAISKKALKESGGLVPNGMEQIISDLSGQNQLCWKQLLKNFIFSKRDDKKRTTLKRMNRRFPFPTPGYRHKRTLTLGVCTDSSGSISNEAHSLFLTEIENISKNCTDVYWIQADCEVQSVEKIKKNKINKTRKGNGGTAYQPAIDKCTELKCDVIVFFGDFDCADTPKDPRVPFLWVGVGNQDAPGKFGKVVRLT